MLRNVVYWFTSLNIGLSCSDATTTEAAVNILHNIFVFGQFRGDGHTVRTLVFGVYKILCITGSYLWVIQKDITL